LLCWRREKLRFFFLFRNRLRRFLLWGLNVYWRCFRVFLFLGYNLLRRFKFVVLLI